MNWYCAADRAALIERVGPAKYNEMHATHLRNSVLETVNGHEIRRINSPRFGLIYLVGQTGRGHANLEGARRMAREFPRGLS